MFIDMGATSLPYNKVSLWDTHLCVCVFPFTLLNIADIMKFRMKIIPLKPTWKPYFLISYTL